MKVRQVVGSILTCATIATVVVLVPKDDPPPIYHAPMTRSCYEDEVTYVGHCVPTDDLGGALGAKGYEMTTVCKVGRGVVSWDGSRVVGRCAGSGGTVGLDR